MEEYLYYTKILKEQLIPATGCTEPIALAYAAAVGRKTLGMLPERITAAVSGSIIKNVKSVVVPSTGGMKGIETAIAAGTVAGQEDCALEVLSCAPADTPEKIKRFLRQCPVKITVAESERVFDIDIAMEAKGHTAQVRIIDTHTNIVLIRRDEEILLSKEIPKEDCPAGEDRILEISKIVEYARTCSLEDVSETIDRQIAYNTALSAEGMAGGWGAEIGRILLLGQAVPDVKFRAMAAAAAGSDARMSGCELPAVINSGSGNQGMTASLPVIVYARRLGVGEEKLIRALIVSDLITVHLKTGIGRLSAYCGAVSAGCGAGAGVCYLYGGGYGEVSRTVVNALAINSGVICDGAKSSCAGKIASAVEAGLLGFEMSRNGSGFAGGDGILEDGVESTIDNVGDIARVGMRETDEEIIRLMIKNTKKTR